MRSIDLDHVKLNAIKKELMKVYPIKDINTPALTKAVKDFQRYVFKLHKHKHCTLAGVVSKRDMDFFHKFYSDYQTKLEKQKAEMFVNHKCNEKDCFATWVFKKTLSYALAEGKLANIQKRDKVLIIGSGPFPSTAISYAKALKCKITCIDRDREAVRLSRGVIKRLRLSNTIKVLHGSESGVDLNGFTIIVVVIMATPKARIMRALKGTNAYIILRTTYGSSELTYEGVDPKLLKGFEIEGRLVRWGKNFTSSLLIRSKRKDGDIKNFS